jgi:hypothetical protein
MASGGKNLINSDGFLKILRELEKECVNKGKSRGKLGDNSRRGITRESEKMVKKGNNE